MGKPYRPSNATEGEWFEARFCDRCDADAPWRDTDGQADACAIHCRTMAFDVSDPNYPSEWVEDESGPRCTAYRPEGTPSDQESAHQIARYEAAMAEMRAARSGAQRS
jgi:hypothetical protein